MSPRPSVRARLRRGRLLLLTAGALAFAVLGLAPASASGPGPIWTTYWEADGTPANSGGGGVAGTWSGTPAYTPFAGGSDGADDGFSFDGSTHVAGPPALGNFGEDDFIVNLIVRTTQADAFQHDLLSTRASCSGAPFWQIFVSGSGEVNLQIYGTDGVNTNMNHPTPINDGNPHNIGFLRSGNTLTLRVDSVDVTATANGTGDYTILDQHVRLGGGNPCTNVGSLREFVGDVDYLYIEQGNDPAGQDLQLSQDSVPVVPAGASGTIDIDRDNLSQSPVDRWVGTFNAPSGVTFTSVSDPLGACTLTHGTLVSCGPTTGPTPPGANTFTIGFDTAPGLTPGSTVNVIGTYTNQTNTDPDHSNDRNVPLAIEIAPEVGVSMVDPVVGGALLVIGFGGVAAYTGVRRRRTATSEV